MGIGAVKRGKGLANRFMLESIKGESFGGLEECDVQVTSGIAPPDADRPHACETASARVRLLDESRLLLDRSR